MERIKRWYLEAWCRKIGYF